MTPSLSPLRGTPRRLLAGTALTVFTIVLAACGGGSSDSTPAAPTTPTTPTTPDTTVKPEMRCAP
ncbi:MAG: hypothetical protein WA159_12695 [Variovorax sp.]